MVPRGALHYVPATMRGLVFLIAAVAAAAMPSAAGAATIALAPVGVDCHGLCSDVYWALRYTAQPGEANQLAVSRADNAYVVHETSAVLEPGEGCAVVDPQTVRCEPTTGLGLIGGTIKTGDGDDTIALDVGPAFTLEGGEGDDTIRGGDGTDLITGGPGRDTLWGGDGADLIVEGDGAEDTIDGGRGGDGVTYEDSRDDLTIDLRRSIGPDGDRFSSLERAVGGSGDDRLHAGRGGSDLAGGPGADVLIGSRRRDELDGGSGRDRLDGRAGNDLLLPRDGAADVVACGAGVDFVDGIEDDEFDESDWYELGPDPADVLAADCERVTTEEEGAPVRVQPLAVTATALRLRLPACPCRGRVTVRAGGRRLGRARIRRGPGTVTVALTHPLRQRGQRVQIAWSYGRDPLFPAAAAYTLQLRP